jgi:hypothetical protein
MDYLKRHHKTKEADIEQTKKLFEEQQRKQKAMAMMNSRPNNDSESIASSFTNLTARSTGRGDAEPIAEEEDGENSSRSRPTSSLGSREDDDGAKKEGVQQKKRKLTLYDDPKASNQLALSEQEPSNKKPRKPPSLKRGFIENGRWYDGGVGDEAGEEQQSSAEMSSISDDGDANMGNDSSTPGGRSIYLDKHNSNMSDVTYNNQGEVGERGDDSTSSVSSAAAVVRGLGSSQLKGRNRRHRSDRIDRTLPSTKEESNGKNANPAKEINVFSITTTNASHHKNKRRGFHYDYREVFLKSNVPQFIATLSGRIVVCE